MRTLRDALTGHFAMVTCVYRTYPHLPPERLAFSCALAQYVRQVYSSCAHGQGLRRLER